MILTLACSGASAGDIVSPPETPSASLRLEVSSADAAPGERIAVAVRPRDRLQGLLLGVQGVVTFDGASLRYLGQAPGPDQYLDAIRVTDGGHGSYQAVKPR